MDEYLDNRTYQSKKSESLRLEAWFAAHSQFRAVNASVTICLYISRVYLLSQNFGYLSYNITML